MKGIIVICFHELVKDKFGAEQWETILEKAGCDSRAVFTAGQEVPDEQIMNIIYSMSDILQSRLHDIFNMFGDYWMNVFAPKVYPLYFKGVDSSKEFLMKMYKMLDSAGKDAGHEHFSGIEYEILDEKSMIMSYPTHGGVMDLMVSFIKAIGRYFDEELKVIKLGNDRMKIYFP